MDTNREKKEVKMMGGIGYDQKSESIADKKAYLGDRPGDVVFLEPGLAGTPLTLPDGRTMLWSTEQTEQGWQANAVFTNDTATHFTKPIPLFSFPQKPDARWSGGASVMDQQGNIHLFGLEYYRFSFEHREQSESYLWHNRSTDGGRSWDGVQNVDFGYKYTGASNNAFVTNTGRIIVPVSALSYRRIGVWVSVCPYSDDGGVTWHKPVSEIAINTGATDWYESGAAEPIGIALKDGRLWLLPRSQDGFQWQTFSYDNGLTWTQAEHTEFVSNQSAMALIRLKDERLFLVWNNCGAEGQGPVHWGAAERAVAAAAISDDEGKTWHGYREIGRVISNSAIGYPYIAQMNNQHVLAKVGTQTVGVDPAFIMNKTWSDDFSFGIRKWSTLASEGVHAVKDPEHPKQNVMYITKPKKDTPSAACANIPYAKKGTIEVTLRLEPNFKGVHMTLSDHYDLPGLDRDGSFPFRIDENNRVHIIGSGGSWLATPGDLCPGTWHTLKLSWCCEEQEARLLLDTCEIARIHMYVCVRGVCYFRIRSVAPAIDHAGLYIRSISMTSHR